MLSARSLGFADVRFADAGAAPAGAGSAVAGSAVAGSAGAVAGAGPLPAERFQAFIAAGRHAGMDWLATSAGDRIDARRIFPSVRTVAVLRLDYGGVAPPCPGPGFGRVASYAWGRDYHNLIGRKLKKLQRRLAEAHPGVRTYASIDSRPVWERAWAEVAGLGYAAKNGCILTPSQGAYYFIATLLFTEVVEPDPPVPARCGACTRCLVACPTGALPGDGSLDAPRCISYLTIEEPGPIAEDMRAKIGSWVYGCDDCQEVCPHVGADRPLVPPELQPHNAWLDLSAVLMADDDWLTAVTTGTPLRRAAPLRLKRNAAIVLGNQGVGRAALEHAARHPNATVAEAASWALERGTGRWNG
ncbi:MAG: tRNA epoxyqueuosine(34) reductase QueG [Myxococcales bacterium]|nr:tRNA epoxyqueuosine(34) reductase QueG [Myxococcales bacterium]